MENILSLIPQRPPFIMVDKLLCCDEHLAQTSFRILNENVLADNGVFTEAGLMENIAQTAAARAGYQAILDAQPVKAGYIASVKNFEVFDLPKVNDEIITEIKIENQVFELTVISGAIKCNGEVMAKCEMNILISK